MFGVSGDDDHEIVLLVVHVRVEGRLRRPYPCYNLLSEIGTDVTRR